jgi:hypothetical protein
LPFDALKNFIPPFLAFLRKEAAAGSFGLVMRIAAFPATVFPMVEFRPFYSVRII